MSKAVIKASLCAGMVGCEALANYDRYSRAGFVRNGITAIFLGCYAMVLSGEVFVGRCSNAIPYYLLDMKLSEGLVLCAGWLNVIANQQEILPLVFCC
jgi:hypothetical protein